MPEVIKKLFEFIFAYDLANQKGIKPWQSKTIWVNILAIVSILLAKKFNIQLTTEDTTIILSLINLVLRMVTKSPVGFYEVK